MQTKTKLIVCLLAGGLLAGGCKNISFAFRSVEHTTYQAAEKGGTITNSQTTGASSVAAEKTTDLKADVPLIK